MSEPPPKSARAVLVAAGNATRMRGAGGARKPLIEIEGRALLEHACAALDGSLLVSSIVIVVHADDLDEIRALARDRAPFEKVVAVVVGGAERCASVCIGAAPDVPTVPGAAAEPPFALYCIHDAARPFVTASSIDRVIRDAQHPSANGAALLAIPVRDTLKRSRDGRRVDETLDRAQLWAAQTPQVFEAERFRDCLVRAARDGFSPTDDASLWERYVGPVTITRGDARNEKITGPEDLTLARALARMRVVEESAP